MPTVTLTLDNATAAYLTDKAARNAERGKGPSTLTEAAMWALKLGVSKDMATTGHAKKVRAAKQAGPERAASLGLTFQRRTPLLPDTAFANVGQETAVVRWAAHAPRGERVRRVRPAAVNE